VLTVSLNHWGKEEAVAKVAEVADATKVINGEGEDLDVLGVEGGNDIRTGHVIATATKLCLHLLIVPVMSGNHNGGDTWRWWGRLGDNNIVWWYLLFCDVNHDSSIMINGAQEMVTTNERRSRVTTETMNESHHQEHLYSFAFSSQVNE
jgi:hypothetical protein